jgi:ABC-type branched-subunit amino acid transport system permease subunit
MTIAAPHGAALGYPAMRIGNIYLILVIITTVASMRATG